MNGTGPGDINRNELRQWLGNLLKFLAPLGLIYTTQVLGILQSKDFVITYQSITTALIPTSFTFGAIVLYLLNGIQDFLRKYLGDNR